METYELRYFLEVARQENIHRASGILGVSPASLSKAIARLESELKVRLFEREVRGIQLTPQGALLMEKSAQILELEEQARIQIQGRTGVINVVIAGPEVLLSKFGVLHAQKIQKKYPHSSFSFMSLKEDEVIKKVRAREAHFGIVTVEVYDGLITRSLEDCQFLTVAGHSHPLAKSQTGSSGHDVSEILKHPFISPHSDFLGKVGNKQSLDGWRDDKFPRQIKYQSTSLKLIEEMVSRGAALAYIPTYVAEPFLKTKQWRMLKVTGCPNSCKQNIKLVARAPIQSSWIRQVF